MNNPPVPQPRTLAPGPVFTLGSALRWLGHDCPHHRRCCGAPIDVMAASVWFLRRGRRFSCYPFQTRVVVADPTETDDALPYIHRLIQQVDICARRDAIEVRLQPRSVVERGAPPVLRNTAEATVTHIRAAAFFAARSGAMEGGPHA